MTEQTLLQTGTGTDLVLSGLEQVAELASTGGPFAPISAYFNMSVVSYAVGDIVIEATPQPQHYNPIGVVHGGIAVTLLDSACGTAVHTSLRPGESYTSLEIKVSFLRSITVDTGPVRAHGWVSKPGTHAAFAEAEIHDGAGRLLATASSTCAVFSTPRVRDQSRMSGIAGGWLVTPPGSPGAGGSVSGHRRRSGR